MKPKTVRMTVYLPSSLKETIRHLANEEGISMNAWMIRALQEYINQEKESNE